MRNIFKFLAKNYVLITFLILQVFSFYLIIKNSFYQQATFVNSANLVTGGVYNKYHGLTSYLNLKDENVRLARENALLHNMIKTSYRKNDKVLITKNDTVYKQQYRFFSAEVLYNTVNFRNNYLTIDKGKFIGVKRDMAVVCADGIVGIVKDVSPNFCTAISLLHKDARISARFKKNNFFGSLTWDGISYQYADLNDIPTHVKIAKGDTIVTTNYSSIFPQGILIGVVDAFEIENAANFYTIKVKLAVNYKKLTHVYLIENVYKQEQDSLLQATQLLERDDN